MDTGSGTDGDPSQRCRWENSSRLWICDQEQPLQVNKHHPQGDLVKIQPLGKSSCEAHHLLLVMHPRQREMIGNCLSHSEPPRPAFFNSGH